MKDITKEERLEYAVLSYLVQFPTHAKYIAEQIALEDGAFSEESRNDAFRALMAEANPSSVVRMQTAMKSLPELSADDFRDFFTGLAPSSVSIVSDFRDFVGHIYKRDLRRATDDITMRDLEPEVMNESLASKQGELNERYNAARDTLSKIVLPSDDGADAKAAPDEPAAAGSDPIDEGLLNMPGFVNELTEYIMKTAHCPNRVLAFAGAITFLAHLAGRKFVGPRDAFPNLYVVALAGSGYGKDHPRKVVKNLSSFARMSGSVIQSVASGQGLEDALAVTPVLLGQFDEFDSVLREIKSDRTGSTATEALSRVLLNVFTSSASIYTVRLKASGQNKPQVREEISHPSFSMFATAIPENFYKSLSQRALTGGLLGRCLVFEAGRRGEDNEDSGLESHPVPFFITNKVEKLAAMPPPLGDRGPIHPVVVAATPEAKEASAAISKEVRALLDAAEGDAMAESVWARSRELVGKIALLYAISANQSNPQVTAEGVNWAWRLVRCLQERMIAMAHDYAAASDKDEKALDVLRIIRKAGAKGILRYVISRKTRFSKEDMDRIEATLVDWDEISVISAHSANGKGTRYKIKNKKGGKK